MFFRALWQVGVSPLKVEGEIEVRLVFSLRDQIGDEGLQFATAFKINLETSLGLVKKSFALEKDQGINGDGEGTVPSRA